MNTDVRAESRPVLLRRKLRWPLLIFLGLAAAIALGWIWLFTDLQRQDKYLRTGLTFFVALALWLVWVVVLSGWPPRLRWSVLGGVVLLFAIPAATLRIRGVTGDLLPIVEWRWSRQQPATSTVQQPVRGAPATTNLTGSFPQFLGPTRDGVISETIISTNWGANPPGELWRRPVGAAWSGFAVVGSRAITQEQQGEHEWVTCYDLLTGRPLWTNIDQSRYFTTMAGEGPRATPTISSNRVYAMGARGILNCLDLESGRVVWRHDTLAENGAKLPMWGVACSPLVTERSVIVTVGGNNSAMVAYDRNNGEKLWASGHDDPHWCSPVRTTLAGVPQIVVFSQNVSAYAEADGKVLWQHPWTGEWPRVATPLVVSTNRVLVSQAYGGGAELLEIEPASGARMRPQRVWKSIRLKSKFANMILLDGYVYGLDDGALVCIDAADGSLKWKGERYGHGQMLLVRGILLISAEGGEIVLVEPTPKEHREIARHRVFKRKTWNPPALAGNYLLVRNDQEAACLLIETRDR